MKNKVVLSLVILMCIVSATLVAQQKIPKKNIEKFSLSVYTKTTDTSDSLRALVYMHIPNFALQFVKEDSLFTAKYEAVIALHGKRGKQIGREVWQDSIVVNDYNKTNSNTDVKILMKSFRVPDGKYKIVGSLLDLDTKRSGENIVKFEISDNNKKQYINPPVLLDKIDGDWGFGENLIPSHKNNIFEVDSGLTVFISGKVLPAEYKLNTKFLTKDGQILIEDEVNGISQSGVIEHFVKFPKDSIQGMGLEAISTLIQNKRTISKNSNIVIRRAGVSHFISDLRAALEQMRYILNSNEKSKVRKSSSKNRERLFKELWDRRDPTPDSETNELMNEYYRRVTYSNAHFDSYVDGWETDMGMIYIIFGAPDDIERNVLPQQQNTIEVWNYYNIQKSFTFVDSDGFGHYRLNTPYLGYRR